MQVIDSNFINISFVVNPNEYNFEKIENLMSTIDNMFNDAVIVKRVDKHILELVFPANLISPNTVMEHISYFVGLKVSTIFNSLNRTEIFVRLKKDGQQERANHIAKNLF